MKPAETVSRSPLDKSLVQLTEEDISQITREECRKFLKEKGMRRPSWNKAQAIEQVISLKALLEPRTESDTSDELRPNIFVSFPANPAHVPTRSEKIAGTDFQVSVVADESLPYRPKDSPKSVFLGDVSYPLPVTDNNNTSPRNMGARDGLVSQMTIFYCGKVNVYDGMPAEKARMILKLAANPIYLSEETPAGNAAIQCQLQASSIIPALTSAVVSPAIQNVIAENSQQRKEGAALPFEVEYVAEGLTSRKASLQRYREKRKDRGKLKSKGKIGVSSSGLEMYLNHQVKSLKPNELSSRSGTSSPPQPIPPHVPCCSSAENSSDKNIGISVDLTNYSKIECHPLFTHLLYLKN